MSKKLVNQRTQEIVDIQTGEIINGTIASTYVEEIKKEPFFLTYSRHMSILYELTKVSTIKVL